MAAETPKTSPWTTISVKGPTAAAVWALQQGYMRRNGKTISQDAVVSQALAGLKAADLLPPEKKTKGTRAVLRGPRADVQD